jgi:hypothetical protein
MRWLWLAVVLVLVAGACSDSDDTSTGTIDSTAVTVTSDSPTGGVTTTPEIVADAETTLGVGSDVDACVLVDADDAESVLGSPAVADTTPAASFGETSSCVWNTESEALMVVSVFEGREFYSGDGFPGSEALAVGDAGYIAVEPNFGGVDLQVVKGDWVLSLTVTPFGVADVEGLPETMTAAAERAVDRLP